MAPYLRKCLGQWAVATSDEAASHGVTTAQTGRGEDVGVERRGEGVDSRRLGTQQEAQGSCGSQV